MSESCEIFIHAAFIVTQNSDRQIIENGGIAVHGGKIVAIGKGENLRQRFTPDKEILLNDHVVMPGLVNAHTHLPMTLLRGFADDLSLMDWLHSHIFPAESKLTRRMLEVGTMLACAELLRFGCTAFVDMYLGEDSIFHAVDKVGLKGLFGEGLFEFPSIGYKNEDEAFERIKNHAAELVGHPRLSLAVAPHSVYTTTPKLLKRCALTAQEYGLPLIIHLSETRQETVECLKTHGKRPVALSDECGLLTERSSLAHCVDLLPDEIELLARRAVQVVHNPKSNMKLASGVAPVSSMLENGLCVALGTDGPSSNNTLNMFSEMSACALLHKVHEKDPTVLPAQTTLDMATINGAKTLHMPEQCSGVLEAGAPADIIALELASPNFNPQHSLVSHLVYAASGMEVCFTMVDGRVLYQDGHYFTLDYPAIRREAQEIADYFHESR